ncbi:hypothetical protein [Sulfurimonas sp.]|jgi:hypothetical protein|nr:hypothetical protein [Sulfurimonas sp.]MDD3505184.1 hypothetical protein [Sulfurimonas sp.]
MIEKELIHSLTQSFEDFANKTDEGIELWLKYLIAQNGDSKNNYL